MKRIAILVSGIALSLGGIFGLSRVVAEPMGMSDGMTMDSEGMKTMMQGMMGNVLPPGIEPALLPAPTSEGAKLLSRYCVQCHNLPGPGIHTAQEWPPVVERMDRRMQMMGGCGMMGRIDAPTDSELRVLIEYLKRYAQTPIDRSEYKDLDSPAGEAFQETCAQCHALPDPRQHTADEWPSVVVRMKQNMVAMGKSVPDEASIGEIVRFLQRHAIKQE